MAKKQTPVKEYTKLAKPKANIDFEKELWGVANEPRGAVAENQYKDIPAFCKSASLIEIIKQDYELTPGIYVGSEEGEVDAIPFEEKMSELKNTLEEQVYPQINLALFFGSPLPTAKSSRIFARWRLHLK